MSPLPRTVKYINYYIHWPPAQKGKSLPTILFFITGNPGLIKYYHNFLDSLQTKQSGTGATNAQKTEQSGLISNNCVIAGFSLGGFEIQKHGPEQSTPISTEGQDDADMENLIWPPTFQRKQLYNLRDQISLCYARLNALVTRVKDNYASASTTSTTINVNLLGHSVGAYIALEMVRLHHATSTEHDSALDAPNPPTFTIRSSILLTPTIMNISHSASGRLATPLLSTFGFLPALLQLSTGVLTTLLAVPRLRWIVGRITGMPAESDALDATVEFLLSPGAVKQALYLAGREMEEIQGDTWGEEVWGTIGVVDMKGGGGREWRAPRLYFWFAGEDHWVAEGTRREIVGIVEGEREEGEGAEIVIDEDEGLVHAWCIVQSEMVARRVRRWVEETLTRSGQM